MNKTLGSDKFVDYFDAKCTIGKGIFYNQQGLLQHCKRAGDYHYILLYSYLTELHYHNMKMVGDTQNRLQDSHILAKLSKIDEQLYHSKKLFNQRR